MTKKSFSGVFFRLFASSFAVSIVIIAMLAFAYFFTLEKVFLNGVKDSMKNSASLISSMFHESESFEKIKMSCADLSKNSSFRTTIINKTGDVVFDSESNNSTMDNHLNRPEIKNAFEGKSSFKKRYSPTLKTLMFYYAVPAHVSANGSPAYCVRLSAPIYGLAETQNAFYFWILLLITLALAASFLSAFFIAKSISKPLNYLSVVSQAFASEKFDLKIRPMPITELNELSESLKKMAKTLSKRIKSINRRNIELDEIFANMAEAVFICNEDGRFLKMNKSAIKLFELGGADFHELKIQEVSRNSKILKLIESVFGDSKTRAAEIELKPKLQMSFTGIPLPYESSKKRALFVLHDISKLKEIENLRKEFVSDISHELKTPITSIKGFVETLRSTSDTEEKNRFLDIIDGESERIDKLVNDMLLLSKIEHLEHLENKNFTSIYLETLLKEAVQIHSNTAKNSKISIETVAPQNWEIFGDCPMLTVALSNLIGNAIKYSPANTQIKVSAAKENGFIKISVADNGTGIAENHLPRIFERFYRVDKGRSRNVGGTGLGLAIVKHIALMHGGNAGVESELGKGSTFSILIKEKAQ